MKKLAIVLTLISSVAFAQKSMIRFDVEGGADSDVASFDISNSNQETSTTTETKTTNILVNYAYNVAPHWQVGVTLGQYSTDNDGTTAGKVTTTGLSGYWNMDEDLANTCFFALHYTMWKGDVDAGDSVTYRGATFEEDDSASAIALEYGHRFGLGKLWGVNVTFAPSVSYTMTTFSDDSADEDFKTTALAWNWLNFDMLF